MGIFNKFKKKDVSKSPEVDASNQEVSTDKKGSKFSLFAKKGKGPSAKKGNVKGNKKSLFGGKKKDLTMIELMQLDETVASASLSLVQGLVGVPGNAVREVDEGMLIIAITNEMLEKAELDTSGEEFGSFAEAIRSDTIESISLAGDLNDGIVGIIPSEDTIISLDEYDFVQDVAFRWAIVPYDLTDDEGLILLDSEVYIDKLVELANNPEIKLQALNGRVTEIGEAQQQEEQYDDYEDEEDYELELDSNDSFDDEDVSDVSEFEEYDDDFIDTDDYTEDDFPEEDYDDLLDDDMDDYTDTSLEDDFDVLDEIDEISAQENKETIQRVAKQTFNNSELGLSIDMGIFDEYFDSINIVKFDTTYQDDSSLEKGISRRRQDANVELERFHQDNVLSLRNKFATSMRDVHNKLVDSLDHKSEDTTYGSKYNEIDRKAKEGLSELDRKVASEVENIKLAYNRDREEFADIAKREALAIYDGRYKDVLDSKISDVRESIKSDIVTEKDIDFGELFRDRQTVANRLFDKATTTLLQNLQEEYHRISQKELTMYDTFRKSMDSYLREHFADEVLRAKAQAELARQSHEAERVREEYEQMLSSKTRQIQDLDEKARDSLRQLETTHGEQVSNIKADYERRIEREQSDNDNLRALLQDSNSSISKIGEQKDKEIAHRLKLYEDTIEAKTTELKYANSRDDDRRKPMIVAFVAVSLMSLIVGIMFGFLYFANKTPVAPVDPVTQESAIEESSDTGSISDSNLALTFKNYQDFDKVA